MFQIRSAKTTDVLAISKMAAPLVDKRVLLGKEMVEAYEAIQEFVVAEQDSRIVGFGALHVMWQDLAEVRTLVVEDQSKRQGIGKALLAELEARAQALGVERVFCLTFEKEFFETNGYQVISDVPVDPATYAELVRSHDNGVAEFLDLARVKQNTLGNSRMLKQL
jgi:amino-acid N-acetyltransferase